MDIHAPQRRTLYPEIQPYETGMLDVGDGHSLYWELSGNPNGKPAVMLHGGPGGGSSPDHRRQWNPDKYKILVFDQRGCGKSTPYASLENNTTWDLVDDIEKLRTQVAKVDKWQVFGGSWGSTLSLAYAQTYPERVTEIILRGIFLFDQYEIDWMYSYGGASSVYPDKWDEFEAPIPPEERHEMMRAYYRRLTGADKAVRIAAAKAWSLWEGETITLLPEPSTSDHFGEGEFADAFARLETHFFVNAGWLEEGQLLRDARRLRGIPGVIAHGRYDMPCPAKNAWALHKAWPESEFYLVEGAGHAYSEPGILDRLIYATDKFAGKV